MILPCPGRSGERGRGCRLVGLWGCCDNCGDSDASGGKASRTKAEERARSAPDQRFGLS